MIRTAVTLLACCLLLGACATAPAPPALPEPPPAAPSNAVASLLDQARGARARGDFDAAAASIERALRLERRNPVLYLELARIRSAQGDYGQAESLAQKATFMAPAQVALNAQAWDVIAQARLAAGDENGALEARRRAAALRKP